MKHSVRSLIVFVCAMLGLGLVPVGVAQAAPVDGFSLPGVSQGFVSQRVVPREVVKKPVLAAPVPHAYRHSDTAIRLSWPQISGANAYAVSRWDGAKQRYVPVKTVKAKKGSSKKLVWVDAKLKTRTVYKYKVKAIKIDKGGKRSYSPDSIWISARTYQKNDENANAGLVVMRPLTMGLYGKSKIEHTTQRDSINIKLALKTTSEDGILCASYWGTNSWRHPFDRKLRFVQLSGQKSARVAADGTVTATGTPGVVKFRAYAHNGNYADGKITVFDYAQRTVFDTKDMELFDTPFNVGIMELMRNYRRQAGEVALYLTKNNIVGDISLNSDATLNAPASVDAAGRELLFDLLDNFPYDMTIKSKNGSSWHNPVEFHVTAWSPALNHDWESELLYDPAIHNENTYYDYPGKHWRADATLVLHR